MSPNALVFRLTPWPAVFISGSLLILATVLTGSNSLLAKICFWAALLFIGAIIERRRVCRIEIDGGGMRAYGITGRITMEIHRQAVEEVVLEEGDGKDYYVWVDDRKHRIPTMYDGFHQVVSVLENWAHENRKLVHSPRL